MACWISCHVAAEAMSPEAIGSLPYYPEMSHHEAGLSTSFGATVNAFMRRYLQSAKGADETRRRQEQSSFNHLVGSADDLGRNSQSKRGSRLEV